MACLHRNAGIAAPCRSAAVSAAAQGDQKISATRGGDEKGRQMSVVVLCPRTTLSFW